MAVLPGAKTIVASTHEALHLHRVALEEQNIETQNDAIRARIKVLEDTAIRWYGDWVAGSYDKNAQVREAGKIYIANKTTTAQPAAGQADWDEL